ncbi:MAG: alpha-mannosidase, partial [Moorea sp. SIO2B7]|nr:alpha-mannosidase [Moorena sp. SIO2B7]
MQLPESPSTLISQIIDKLRQLTSYDTQRNWHYYSQDLSITTDQTNTKYCPLIDPANWQIASVNHKGYITWSAGHQVRWLAQKLIIPHDLHGYPLVGLSLRLVLTWWAEDAQIFVNGKLIQQGDLFDSSSRILLTNSATPGETIIVALRLISPGHDIGALMRSQCIYEADVERGKISQFPIPIDPAFVADELTVLHKYLEAFQPDKLEILATEIRKIDWNIVSDTEAFLISLSILCYNLQSLPVNIKQRCLHLLGHAHLDMAWLWTTGETWEVAQRTFTSVLNLQKDFPELTFCHTTPALYEWIEQYRPDLFSAIQQATTTRNWEVLGGMWVEPEVNLVSGESLIRQLLYGQRYIKKKFGDITKVAWLPDSFG